MFVSDARTNVRQTIDFSKNRAVETQPESSFGRDQLDLGRGEANLIPKGVAQATSGWLGDGGCLDFTGSAVEVKSTYNENQSLVNACTGGATDVKSSDNIVPYCVMGDGADIKSGFVNDSGIFMQCVTGSATDVKSTLQDGQTILNYCTAGATDVKSGFVQDSGIFYTCMTGSATEVKSGFVNDSGLFMQCVTGSATDVKSGGSLGSF